MVSGNGARATELHTGKAASNVPTRRRGLRRGDLRREGFPSISGATPQERAQAVEALREWAEHQAEGAIEWYMKDKRLKRSGSRLLRALTVLLAVGGSLAPLQAAAVSEKVGAWGYVLLAAAAGCVAFDYFFGVSTGWMRDMAAIQSLQRELTTFRLDWATELLRGGPADADPGQPMASQLLMIGRLKSAVDRIVESETTDWLAEFRLSLGRMHDKLGKTQSGP
ncbi:SLATT domain-containing protein [Actinocrinis puniceicyclus]|uniref:SLATT domain-containing protein n=1 Tax=Actinocrinis puniceicyclus TaxID=977794 RepID=A0A8J8BBN2_9ACTN|nr:SLATT domain-containing protein [Actinocrinis puniceicyclus]MBS2964237.1 SLATT domain-containing protein [Actinocrinis puniceicyclus]